MDFAGAAIPRRELERGGAGVCIAEQPGSPPPAAFTLETGHVPH